MNTKMILSNLNEGLEQLQQTVEEIKTNPEYGIEEYKEYADADFNRWRKFPKEDELYLDTEI
jgi:hypothetical protein